MSPRWRSHLHLAFGAAALIACAPAAPARLLEPEPSAPGALGERGSYGAELQRRSLAPTNGGAVDADVIVPVDGPTAGPFPVVVLLHGGAVPPERYRWLGAHLASRGVVVAAPTHPFDLPFFAIDHASRALRGLQAAGSSEGDVLFGLVGDAAMVCGHSLGGVVAAKAWRDEPGFAALALFASYPDPADSFEGRAGRVLSLAGEADGKTTLVEAVEGAATFDAAQLVVIDAMTHYQWTDGATESEIAGDAPPTAPDDEVRRVAMSFVDALVEEVAGVAPWPFDEIASWPAGASAP
ncbi:MAG: hypothetical protein IT383_12230 [Deltaproteobacteria bacterium]|nr:hypothetical protein [Deltaproteobacteria bacterium]